MKKEGLYTLLGTLSMNGKYTFLHAGVNSSQPHISINLPELIRRIIPQQMFREMEPHLPLIESLLYAHKPVRLPR